MVLRKSSNEICSILAMLAPEALKAFVLPCAHLKLSNELLPKVRPWCGLHRGCFVFVFVFLSQLSLAPHAGSANLGGHNGIQTLSITMKWQTRGLSFSTTPEVQK